MNPLTRLLLVEDSEGDAGLLRAALRTASGDTVAFDLIHVRRLADALQRLRESVFDLVLLDLSLPDGHGIDTVARIRTALTAVPIVILTGLDDEAVAIEAMRLGAQDYLIKGQVEGHTLVRAIRYAIERQRVDAQLEEQRWRQAVLHEVNVAITSTLDLQFVLDSFLDKVKQLLPEFAITVRLLNHTNGILEPLACRSVDETAWKRALAGDMAAGRAYAVLAAREPLVIEDVRADPRTIHQAFMRDNGLVSYVGVPLYAKAENLGVVGFYTRVRRQFPREEVKFLATLAGQAAVAIHNSQLYESLRQTNAALEKTLEVKGVLVGVLAHELKTPLQVIMGASSLLSSGVCGELSPDQQQRVAAIERGADELLKLIDSTLTTARLEQGTPTAVISEFNVAPLLAELETEFAEAFQKKEIAFTVQKPVPDVTMQSDRIKLKGILRNLVENARKFTHHGKVEVTFSSVAAAGRVEFTVRDTGIGIKKEALPKIFELFYQADPAMELEHVSAGLGLNIVKRLVAALSGAIEVDSEVDKGTTFRVYLPKDLPPTPLA
jgi:signal transduction histidine kinase/DNA-binding response OmpR family regulator